MILPESDNAMCYHASTAICVHDIVGRFACVKSHAVKLSACKTCFQDDHDKVVVTHSVPATNLCTGYRG